MFITRSGSQASGGGGGGGGGGGHLILQPLLRKLFFISFHFERFLLIIISNLSEQEASQYLDNAAL